MAELNDNYEKGTLLMTQALKKYAEGDYEGGDIDREKANKYYDLAKLEIDNESGKITALYGENRNFGIVYKVLENNFRVSFQDKQIKKTPIIEALKKIKNNKKLNEQFKFFNAFTNPKNVVNAEEYVNEVIELFPTFKQKELNAINENLINFIQSKNINELIDIENKELDLFESINFILTNKKNLNNINEYLNHRNNIVNYVKEHNIMTTKKTNIDEHLNECIADLEDKYDILLNDDEKEFIYECLNNTSSGKEEYFNIEKNALLTLINEHISHLDEGSTKTQWLDIKDKIDKSVFNEKSFIVDISKITEIKNKLS